MSTPKKPGYRTSEFWLTLACLIFGMLLASGVVTEGSNAERIVAFGASVLASFGYSFSRGMVKKAEALTSAITPSDKDPD